MRFALFAVLILSLAFTINSQSTMYGKKTGMASWFQANIPRDRTNGIGWCGKPYNDHTLGFAPPMKLLSPSFATWYSNPEQWKKDTAKWCGLEARVTNPQNGKSMLLYIVDAFEPKFVKTEYAIDVLLGPYSQLAGDPKGDKNKVIMNMQWELTGKRIKL